jgi:hypothetical protein
LMESVATAIRDRASQAKTGSFGRFWVVTWWKTLPRLALSESNLPVDSV